jgi:homoserine O-acetyltransferase
MGRVYAGWAMSQAFYRHGLHITAANPSLEDYLVRSWEGNFLRRDGDDLLAMLATWTASDISANDRYKGDLTAALRAIQAKTFIMPSRTDLYFTPEDAEAECRLMPNAEFRPIESVWGHRAGNPVTNPEDMAFLRRAVDDLAAAFHALWNKGKDDPSLRFIQQEDRDGTLARLALIRAAAHVIAAGLGILGVEPIEEMR